jgi:hypothetical protein
MAMKIGRPVAFFVSDPKLWLTVKEEFDHVYLRLLNRIIFAYTTQ